MILDYVNPMFCNVISFQSNLGHFSKDIAISLYKTQNRIKKNKRFKIKDTTIQTILDDFGFKSGCYKVKRSYKTDLVCYGCFKVVDLDYWFFNNVNDYKVVDMGVFDNKKVKFGNEVNKSLYGDSVGDIRSNVHILSDGSFEMLNPRCPDCGSFDVIKKDFVESSPKVEYHGNMKLRVKRYYCKKCDRKFQTKIASIKDDGKRFSKGLNEKIRDSFANRGGSLDQIANDLKIFLNIDISHQTVKNALQFDFNQVEYYEETVKDKEIKQATMGFEINESDKLYYYKEEKR